MVHRYRLSVARPSRFQEFRGGMVYAFWFRTDWLQDEAEARELGEQFKTTLGDVKVSLISQPRVQQSEDI